MLLHATLQIPHYPLFIWKDIRDQLRTCPCVSAMAVTIPPVELPTDRRSYLNTAPGPDIHDPNWIPVLDSARYKPPSPSAEKEALPLTPGSFSLFPNQSQSNSPRPRPPLSHNYSKSSLAPESLASDSRSQSPSDNVEPLPNIQQAQSDAGAHRHPYRRCGERTKHRGECKYRRGATVPTSRAAWRYHEHNTLDIV